ncbi:hypothetical protein [Halorussus halobius]|uniref:hypothetical protein n=1 Tax=Halorussus halobius TaxID=1710537 RepID=UPI001FCF0E2A|nr:hypothetical protein [Halorussus halobius]
MGGTDLKRRTGIVVLVVASVLLFGPVALGLPPERVVGAFAVLGLAAGAYLVGTAEDGRPVEAALGAHRIGAATGAKGFGVVVRTMDDETQLRGGIALLVVGAVVLFSPLVMELRYTLLLLAAAVLVLAGGALLVGLSRRGRAV